MNFDFSALNFETIDSNINAYPDMFLNQNGVTFTKKVLEDLGYPAFVLCLLDAKARVFAIRSCKSNEPKGFKFSKPRGEQKGVVTISNKNLLDPLRAVTGEDWIPGKRYKVRGFWVADAKTMCFDLNEGVQEDFRPVTPSTPKPGAVPVMWCVKCRSRKSTSFSTASTCWSWSTPTTPPA